MMPTILRLMGRIDDTNQPDAALYKLGYRRFPGRVIKEIANGQTSPARASRASPTSPVK
jgi:hypothetical protein